MQIALSSSSSSFYEYCLLTSQFLQQQTDKPINIFSFSAFIILLPTATKSVEQTQQAQTKTNCVSKKAATMMIIAAVGYDNNSSWASLLKA